MNEALKAIGVMICGDRIDINHSVLLGNLSIDGNSSDAYEASGSVNSGSEEVESRNVIHVTVTFYDEGKISGLMRRLN